MLELGRLDTGQFSITCERLDSVELTRRTLTALAHTLRAYTLTVCLPGTPLFVECDAIRLQQVLENLIGNAIKYSSQGSTITVAITQQADQVRIAVADQGIGIPKAAHHQLFQRFYRVHQDDERQIGGLGMGMYVVKEIVEAHGGSVTVESEQGVGSTFTACLPLAANARLHDDHELRVRSLSA